MEPFLVLILSLFIAAATTLFAFVLSFFPNFRYRDHLPTFFGVLLVAVVFIISPQQSMGIVNNLTILVSLSPMLLLPFFILAPVPYIEKWTGTAFNKFSVFFGSFLTSLFYFVIVTYGNYYSEQIWLEGLLWTICSIVPAFFIFCGAYFCQKFLEETQSEKSPVSLSEKRFGRIPMEKKKIIVLIVAILFFLSPFLLIGILGDTEGCGRFAVDSIDQSQTLNGTIIHLTEDDFRVFPKMSSIIKNAAQVCATPGNCTIETEKEIGGSWFACRDEQGLRKYVGVILEYKGNFYSMKQTMVY